MANETAKLPPFDFYFNVKIDGFGSSINHKNEDRENRYTKKSPVKTKSYGLVLKQGFIKNSKNFNYAR